MSIGDISKDNENDSDGGSSKSRQALGQHFDSMSELDQGVAQRVFADPARGSPEMSRLCEEFYPTTLREQHDKKMGPAIPISLILPFPCSHSHARLRCEALID